MRVENCWRQLESDLAMRPVRHFRPWRIQAHVTIAVLALLLERVVEIRAGDTWRNVVAELGRIKVVSRPAANAWLAPGVERRVPSASPTSGAP